MSCDLIDSGMPPLEKVRELEQHLQTLPQVDVQTTHLIHGGMYARTIFVPAGCVLTGTKTNVENVCIVSGDITVTTDAGLKRMIGYSIIPANAGFKRAGFAHSDTYWTTLIPTSLTDITAIEDFMTDESDMLLTRSVGIGFVRTQEIEA